ncbi:hypothetical protein GCK72_025934 [Caenorhabditis remanei]|uniref:DUF38 domain-containing protein n=1 Tax=Caenorhabditis remanei TaxID=31234 RepID=A0A6A5G3I5_CAERE|nr:hypothetical protein GCK72_025934 [Caenorhabditis remanei]KAF1749466.1 hypothetical protein GCK72_025934 [Caenorhabditis remanei]
MFGAKSKAINEPAKNLPVTFTRQFLWTPVEEQEGVCEYIKEKLHKIKEKPFYIYLFGSEDTNQPELCKKLNGIIVEYFKSKEACSVSAPNDSYAADVNGSHLCSTFLLKLDGDLSNENMNLMDNDTEKQLGKLLLGVKTIIFYKFDLINPIFLKRIDQRLRIIFKKEQPFGGLSVIAFGDIAGHSILTSEILKDFEVISLSNLTPDNDEDEETKLEKYYMGLYKKKSFNTKKTEVCAFDELKRRKMKNPELQLVVLSYNKDLIELVNKMELNELKDEKKTFRSNQVTNKSEDKVQKVKKVVDSLEIGVGSTVISTCDLKEVKLGELGKVTSFNNHDGSITVDFHSEKSVKVRTALWTADNLQTIWEQFPLQPAAALTMEDVEGLMFDGVIVMPDGINDSKTMNKALGKAKDLGTPDYASTLFANMKPTILFRIKRINFGDAVYKQGVEFIRFCDPIFIESVEMNADNKSPDALDSILETTSLKSTTQWTIHYLNRSDAATKVATHWNKNDVGTGRRFYFSTTVPGTLSCFESAFKGSLIHKGQSRIRAAMDNVDRHIVLIMYKRSSIYEYFLLMTTDNIFDIVDNQFE